MRYQDGYTLPRSTPRALLSKRRRRAGLHCAMVVLTEEHCDALIKLAWLKREDRNRRGAIEEALSGYLYYSLVQQYFHTLWARTAREDRQAGR